MATHAMPLMTFCVVVPLLQTMLFVLPVSASLHRDAINVQEHIRPERAKGTSHEKNDGYF